MHARILVALVAVVLLSACEPTEGDLALPAPAHAGGKTLTEVLAARRSVRDFTPRELERGEVGQLLWAAQGFTRGGNRRAAPSAGALYPLEVYVATEAGLFHYEPAGHRLVRVRAGDPRPAIHEAALRQGALLEAPAVFLITGVVSRTSRKYGPDRSPRYMHMEAGHAAQNLLLQATALGLGGVTIGAFRDDAMRETLALPPGESPLYLIPVGTPRP